VQPFSINHARNDSKSRTFVLNRLPRRFPVGRPNQNAHFDELLPDIDSRTSFDFHVQHWPLLDEEKLTLVIRIASRALLAPIGGSSTTARPVYSSGLDHHNRESSVINIALLNVWMANSQIGPIRKMCRPLLIVFRSDFICRSDNLPDARHQLVFHPTRIIGIPIQLIV
jgi:hypothetical protein